MPSTFDFFLFWQQDILDALSHSPAGISGSSQMVLAGPATEESTTGTFLDLKRKVFQLLSAVHEHLYCYSIMKESKNKKDDTCVQASYKRLFTEKTQF